MTVPFLLVLQFSQAIKNEIEEMVPLLGQGFLISSQHTSFWISDGYQLFHCSSAHEKEVSKTLH